MGCGTNIVPGFKESNKIKDPRLQMKMDQLLSSNVKLAQRMGYIIPSHSVGPTLKENKAFKKWFGKSKVVDKDGNPMIVYHGSPNIGFTKFDLRKANPNDPDSPINGFFFSTHKYDAKQSGKHPYYAKRTGQHQTRAFYLKIENPINRYQLNRMHRDLMERGVFLNKEEMRQHLVREGYDGLILNNNYFELEDALRKDGYYKATDGSNLEFEVITTKYRPYERDQETGTLQLADKLEYNKESVIMFRGNKTVGQIYTFSSIKEAAEQQHGTYVAFNPKQIKSASANKGRYGGSSNVYK